MSFAEALAPHQVPAFQGNATIAMATTGSDRNLHVEFFVDNVYQSFESEKQGRAIYLPVDKVRISAPGAKSDIIKTVEMEDQPNYPSHPRRFPAQWAAFKAQQTQVPDGTPLEMCKFIAAHRVLELTAQRVYTAEQYSELPDSILQTLGLGARRERDLCKAYLSEDTKVAELSEALARESALKADMEMMKQQLAQFNAAMSLQMAAEGKIYQSSVIEPELIKRGPGRPKKETE